MVVEIHTGGMKMKKRVFGLDLVRAVAILFVVIVHVFLHVNFVSVGMSGTKNFFLLWIRNIALSCVPLFIILTGYCKCNKKVNKEHYKSIWKILVSYFVIACITILYKKYYVGETLDFQKHIMGILRFDVNEYAWYLEMYLGLFLLIPFLNILYKNIETKRQKKILLFSLFLICSLPQTLNPIVFGNTKLDILPRWWNILYPFLYYYIGCYIREYQTTFRRLPKLMWILIISLLQTGFIYIYCGGSSMIEKNIIPDYFSVFTLLISVLIFLLLYRVKTKSFYLQKTMEFISKNTLELYLLSFIFDHYYYKLFISGSDITHNAFMALGICVPFVFLASLFSA